MRHRRLVISILVLLLVTVIQIAAPLALYSDPVDPQIFYNPTVVYGVWPYPAYPPYYYYPARYGSGGGGRALGRLQLG